MTRSKNQLARQLYSCDFEDLSGAEKAHVTRKFNAQSAPAVAAPVSGAVRAEVGRVGYNGVKACLLREGATVADLLRQASIELDTKKEGVIAQSTGRSVALTSRVVSGETYMIAPEIKSAE